LDVIDSCAPVTSGCARSIVCQAGEWKFPWVKGEGYGVWMS